MAAKKKKTQEEPQPTGGRPTFKKEIVVEVDQNDGQREKFDRLAEVDREILDVIAEKAAANSEFTGQLKGLRKEQTTLLDVLQTGKETIEVDCYEEVDEQRLEMVTRRMMGEAPSEDDPILHEFTRPLTAQERQVALPGPEPEGGEDDDADRDPGMDENEDDAA